VKSENVAPYLPLWMQEASDVHGSYLPPALDFASHSQFGGQTWFERFTRNRVALGVELVLDVCLVGFAYSV
jgi:hypothetical protein